MARPSKLTEQQWDAIHRRFLSGETARSLGREYGVSEAAIRKKYGANQKLSEQSTQVRNVAEKLAVANQALAELPPVQRPVAVSLAEKLQNISNSLAAAAELGANTSQRLAQIANKTASSIPEESDLGEDHMDKLKGVAVLTRMANDAGSMGLGLLNANKERLKPEGPDMTELAPVFNVTLTTEDES